MMTDDDDDEFPVLTDEQLDRMRPAREVMPPAFFEAVKRKQGQRGPGKKPAKKAVTIRLDPGILDALKATGPGWQTRVNEALRSVISRTPPKVEKKSTMRRAAPAKRVPSKKRRGA